MSHLSRLIEQARRTRRVNDIFNFQPALGRSQDAEVCPDMLLARLAELESHLFDNPPLTTLAAEDLVSELEKIAGDL